MIDIFNPILFALTFVFGMNAPIFSDYVELNFNLEEKTIELFYPELKTYADYEDNTERLISYLDSLNTLDTIFSGLNLTSNSYKLVDGKYNYMIQLKYSSLETIKDYYKIDFDSMKVFVHSRETIVVNFTDTLETDVYRGENKTFTKSDNFIYRFRYEWNYDDYLVKPKSLSK